VRAQPAASGGGLGIIHWKGGGVRDPAKKRALARKRIFLFAGDLEKNKGMIAAIKAIDMTSRDCFYTNAKASSCLIAWLEAESCESPFCRKPTKEDVDRVPEFKTAFQRILTFYGNRPDLGLDWVLDAMDPELGGGYFRQRRSLVQTITRQYPPLQQLVTTANAGDVKFVDLVPGIYTVTTLIPIEINQSSFLWIDQVPVEAGKVSSVLAKASQTAPEKNPKVVKSVIQKDLKRCSSATCPAK
jgi:hypothetical protein